MQANSRVVSSNQHSVHPRLAEVVGRHLRTTHRAEISAHNIQAYERLSFEIKARPRPLVLDSFCGTGHSTAALAERHPGHLIVGIDKSARRLAKHPHSLRGNYLLLRADCEDIWTLLAGDGLRPDYHYMLYPNPWPKAAHLQRRIHGHPSFPLLLTLGGTIELRSNWKIYAEEFGCAMHLAGHRGRIVRLANKGPDLTLFEQKYRCSGHALWSYTVNVKP
ncbi:MAG: SAM-dependent methyltransferase [Deltaproteobacteria bacterium]|nr:SAM-dependent methyltransferase [Deltaproteobacteria bacterium]